MATCNLPFNQCATNQLATRCAGAPPLPPSSPATWLKSTIPSQLARNSLGSTFGLTIGSCWCCCLCWLTVLSAGQISVKCAHVWVCLSFCVRVCVLGVSVRHEWLTVRKVVFFFFQLIRPFWACFQLVNKPTTQGGLACRWIPRFVAEQAIEIAEQRVSQLLLSVCASLLLNKQAQDKRCFLNSAS